MSNRKSIHAPRLALSTPNAFIEVYVSYDDGKGPGYDDGKEHKRGYSLHMQPLTEERKDGYVVKTMTAYTGMKGFIEGATRYNARRHQELADQASATDLYRRMLDNVLQRNDLKLA